MNTITLLEWLWQDTRYATRVLRRSPGFTIAAVLTLALGIGGVTVTFSALRNILLDPFPYVKSDRMVNVFVMNAETADRHYGGAMGQDESIDFWEQQTAFEAVVVSATDNAVMRTASGSDIVAVSEMTPNTFPFLGVQPLKGACSPTTMRNRARLRSSCSITSRGSRSSAAATTCSDRSSRSGTRRAPSSA